MMADWSGRKLTLVSLVVALAIAALIWGAWELEERKKSVRTRVLEKPDDGTFVVEIEDQEPFDLILYCNEEKFQQAFEAFTKSRRLEGKYPPLVVPGGPMVIALADQELPENLQPAKRAAIEYLKRHAPRKVILVAHGECLLYDSITAWRDNLDEVHRVQHEHLIRAKEAITLWFPTTEVELFYADLRDGKMTFYPMAEELSPLSLDPDEFGSATPIATSGDQEENE